MRLVFLLLALSFKEYVNAEPVWESFRVTFGNDLLSSRFFAKLPMTESKARSDGFFKLSDRCSDGKFLGYRYMKGLDSAAVLLFDVKGHIAGIQFGIPKYDVENMISAFSYDKSSSFILDTIFGEEEYYFQTAYFVDPSIICTRGRTREEFLREGPGTGAYFQNGTDPIRDSKEAPLYERDLAGTLWIKGGCVKGQGQHYWYDMSEHMSCEHLFPFTLMYFQGKLATIAFSTAGYFEFSKRIEHPTLESRPKILPVPVAKCIGREYQTAGGFSAMHVFFTARPWNIHC